MKRTPIACLGVTLLAGFLAFLDRPSSVMAFDQWGDNGSTNIGSGSGPPPPPGDPGKNDNSDKDNKGKEAEPVDLFTGQFELSAVDVDIRGRMPLRVLRMYRSGSSFHGMFGRGWNLEYNERILILATNGNLLLRYGNSARDEFKNRGDGTFAPPPGRYDTLERNVDGSYTLREKHGTVRNYNNEGCLSEIRDRNGHQLLFSYQVGGKLPINAVSDYSHYTNAILVARDYRLTRMEVAHSNTLSGRFIQFNYDPNGRVTNVVDFTGRSWRYEYDAAGQGSLLAVTTPAVPGYAAGLTTRYAYASNSFFRLASITDPAGQTYLTNLYNSAGQVVTQFWGAATYRFAYPAEGSSWVTNGNGFKVERSFDTNGNVLSMKQYTAGLRPTDPAFYLTRYAYDTNNEQAKVIYPAGNVETRRYDVRGNLTETRRKVADTNDTPADISSDYTYESAFNFTKTASDANGNVTTYLYDYELPGTGRSNGNIAQIIYPAVGGTNPVVSFSHNVYGQVDCMTNAAGTVTRFIYDNPTGFLLQRIEAYGTSIAATNKFTYDSRGNALTATDARGNTTSYTYDALDRLTAVTNAAPFGYATRYCYNANGKIARIERQTGDASHPWQTTAFGYDILDRLKAVTNDLGQVTQYTYDANGNRTQVTDANGNSTTFAFDERNLLWKVTDAMTNVVRYSYNPNGGLAQLADARSNVTAYAYDPFDRLTTTTYPDSSTELYAYDAAGNLAAKGSRAGTLITNSYDALSRRTQRTYSDGSAITYNYDVRGLLSSATDLNGALTFAYDSRGRLVNSTNTFGHRVAYEYDACGNRSKLVYPDGSFVTYGYDGLNRLTSIQDGGTNLVAAFAYDALNRRTQLTYGNGTKAAYAYDWANNLTNLLHTVTNTCTTLGRFAYAYESVGNRLSMTTEGIPYPGAHVYTYDKTYQLTSADYPAGYPFPDMSYTYDSAGNRTKTVDGGTVNYIANNLNQYTSVASKVYSYSANGNLATDGSSIFNYDDDNQLVWAAKAGTSATYTYDPFGRRIEKNVNGNIRRFVYAGDHIIAETDASGSALAKNVFGNAIDELLRADIAASRYYAHADALGSTRFLTDSAGSNAESYSYDAYGRVSGFSSAPMTRFLFTGREYDPETGLYDYRSRHYSSQMGRFLQADTIGYEGGVNLYAYCDNNPLAWVDPWGLTKKEDDLWDKYNDLANKANRSPDEDRQMKELMDKITDLEAIQPVPIWEDPFFNLMMLRFPHLPSAAEPIHYGINYGPMHLLHYGVSTKYGPHVGLLPSLKGIGKALVHLYRNRIYIH